MKILHLVDSFGYADGCARQVFLLAREQRKNNHAVAVCFGEGTAGALLAADGIPHFVLDGIAHRRRSVYRFVRGIAQLRRVVRSLRPHIIHAHHFYCGNQCRLVPARGDWRLVQTVHSGADFEGRLPQFVGERIIAVSDNIRELIVRKKPNLATRVVVIRNSSDFVGTENTVRNSGDFQELVALKRASFVVCFCGRVEEEKGIWILVDALRSLGAGDPFILCVIGGGARLEEMIQKTRVAGIRAVFFGELENVRPVLEQCDVLVLPSEVTEGHPMVLSEAGLLGRSVIASRIGGIPEIVEHGVSGLLVEPGSVDDLAKALQTLRDSADLRARLGANLHSSTAARNNIAGMARAVEQVYAGAHSDT